jgi:hypothetical protein
MAAREADAEQMLDGRANETAAGVMANPPSARSTHGACVRFLTLPPFCWRADRFLRNQPLRA